MIHNGFAYLPASYFSMSGMSNRPRVSISPYRETKNPCSCSRIYTSFTTLPSSKINK